MAISISEQYPGKTAGNTTKYPYGEPRNVDAPGDGKGTPWEAAIVKDDQGFKQAILKAAKVVPSGQPDTADESQYLDALKKIMGGLIPKPEFGIAAVGRANWQGTLSYTKGIKSISRIGEGLYEVTLEKNAPNTNYCVFVTVSWGGRLGAAGATLDARFSQTRNKFRFRCDWGGDNTNGSYNPDIINVQVIY